MPGIQPLLVAAMLLLASCSQGPRHGALPQGMGRFPSAWAKEPVIILADSSTWTVLPTPGDSNNLERRSVTWFRINRKHPPLLQSLSFQDDETTETPPEIRVDAYYPDGTLWSAEGGDLPRSRARILGIVASNGFHRSLRFPRYVEGMIVRREVRQRVVRPEFRNREFLRGEFPCLRRQVAFRYPAAYRLKAGLRNGEGLSLAVDTLKDSGHVEIRVSGAALPRLQPFARLKYPEDWYSAFHFSVPARGSRSPGWEELGDVYLEQIGASLAPSRTVRALADSLKGDDPDSLARQAFSLLIGRIRYLADEADLNAYIPRHPDTILANGYGDCKEMANLMRALLREKGVQTGLALVHFPGRPQLHADFPSLAPFNHMILYRRAPDGSTRFYDPTMASADPGASYLHLMGQKVLLLSPGGSSIDTVDAVPGYRNRASTRSELVIAKPGKGAKTGKGWELRGVVGLKGKAAFEMNMTLRYRHPGKDEARTAVWDFLAEGFGIQATEWDWRAPAGDSLEIDFAMPAEQMAVGLGKGGVKLDVPTIMGLGAQEVDYEGDRHYAPFEQEDAWALPAGYKPVKPRRFQRNGVDGRWSSADNTARRSFRCSGMIWKAGEKPQLVRFLDQVSEFALAAVWR